MQDWVIVPPKVPLDIVPPLAGISDTDKVLPVGVPYDSILLACWYTSAVVLSVLPLIVVDTLKDPTIDLSFIVVPKDWAVTESPQVNPSVIIPDSSVTLNLTSEYT